MPSIPTIRVIRKDSGGEAIINEADFNPQEHGLPGEPPSGTPTPTGEAPPTPSEVPSVPASDGGVDVQNETNPPVDVAGNVASMSWQELVSVASEAGIDVHRRKREEVEADLIAHLSTQQQEQ